MVWKRSWLGALALWVLLLPACRQEKSAAPGASPAYDQLLRTLYHGTVPTIRPAELAAELGTLNGPLLLDTRTPAEFRVSHLQQAHLVSFDQYQMVNFRDLPRDRPVVVYCSIGCRSEQVGERLQKLGFKNVRNLYGGIFEWVNEGHPVYNAQGPTNQVHPYSPLWSPWLRRGQKVY